MFLDFMARLYDVLISYGTQNSLLLIIFIAFVFFCLLSALQSPGSRCSPASGRGRALGSGQGEGAALVVAAAHALAVAEYIPRVPVSLDNDAIT